MIVLSSVLAVEKRMARLEQENEGQRRVVSSLREECRRVQEEKKVLEQILHHVQGRCQEKIKVCARARLCVCVCLCVILVFCIVHRHQRRSMRRW